MLARFGFHRLSIYRTTKSSKNLKLLVTVVKNARDLDVAVQVDKWKILKLDVV